MITKAVIEGIIDKHSVKVRIPIFNMSGSDSHGTPIPELPEATICTLPACYISPQVGDVVYVGFEDNHIGKPVILGYLQREGETDTSPSMTVQELSVTGQLFLPKREITGTVSGQSTEELTDIFAVIESVSNLVEERIQDVEEYADRMFQETQEELAKVEQLANIIAIEQFSPAWYDIGSQWDVNDVRFEYTYVDTNTNEEVTEEYDLEDLKIGINLNIEQFKDDPNYYQGDLQYKTNPFFYDIFSNENQVGQTLGTNGIIQLIHGGIITPAGIPMFNVTYDESPLKYAYEQTGFGGTGKLYIEARVSMGFYNNRFTHAYSSNDPCEQWFQSGYTYTWKHDQTFFVDQCYEAPKLTFTYDDIAEAMGNANSNVSYEFDKGDINVYVESEGQIDNQIVYPMLATGITGGFNLTTEVET